MAKDASITVRLPSDLKAQLEAAAAKEDRTLSKLVERVLADWQKGQGKRRDRA